MYQSKAHSPVPAAFPESGIAVVESHHSTDFRMEPTRADYLKTACILAGSGQLQIGRGLRRISPRSLCVIPAGVDHRFVDDPAAPLSLLLLCVQPHALAAAGNAPLRFERAAIFHHKPAVHRCRELMRQLAIEQTIRGVCHDLVMLALTWQLLAMLKRSGRQADPESPFPAHAAHAAHDPGERTPARARVEAYLHGPPATLLVPRPLDEAAESVGLSRRRFTALVHEITGQSWLEYCRRLRIAHAGRILRDTSRTVLSIAFECGFEDLSTFYRTFRKFTGSSPERWRAKLRDEIRGEIRDEKGAAPPRERPPHVK